jgi:hypothetical protein
MCGHREHERRDVIRRGGGRAGGGSGCDMKDSICRLDLGKQMRRIESREEKGEGSPASLNSRAKAHSILKFLHIILCVSSKWINQVYLAFSTHIAIIKMQQKFLSREI